MIDIDKQDRIESLEKKTLTFGPLIFDKDVKDSIGEVTVFSNGTEIIGKESVNFHIKGRFQMCSSSSKNHF